MRCSPARGPAAETPVRGAYWPDIRAARVGAPIYPRHTGRSVFINQQALPILEQEVLQAQFNPNIEMVSGATYTSSGFVESLQAALLSARRV